MQAILTHFFSDPILLSRVGLRFVHFCGLVIGLGAATLLDLIIVRFAITRIISEDYVRIIEFSSKVVSVGLGLLWLSGIGFLVHYGLFDPAKLWNPKIWAKISIVVILTINGIFVHSYVLPALRDQMGRSLFEGISRSQRSFLLSSGAVSAISWYVPLMLGAFPQFNFIVPAWVILVGYFVIVASAAVAAQAAVAMMFGELSLRRVLERRRVLLWRAAFPASLALIAIPFSLDQIGFFERLWGRGKVQSAPVTEAIIFKPANSGPLSLVQSTAEAWQQSPTPKVDDARKFPNQNGPSAAGTTEATPGDGGSASGNELVVTSNISNIKSDQGQLPPDHVQRATSSSIDATPLDGSGNASQSLGGARSEFASVSGLWAVDSTACARGFIENDLHTVIDTAGASAGDTSCRFRNISQTSAGNWAIAGKCSDTRSRWKSDIRLTLSGQKLRWSSQKGTQIYVRCQLRSRQFALSHQTF
jgi:hypothetical protein